MISPSLLLEMLPRDLRGELCIAGTELAARGRAVTFRMDPGPTAFERRATITVTGGGWFRITVGDRYLPGAPPADVAGAHGMTAADVPDELRGAAARAWTRAAERPHWRSVLAGVVPRVLAEWPGRTLTGTMTYAAAHIARNRNITCFLTWDGRHPRCLTAPPHGPAAFLSVTPDGCWAFHSGHDTYPVQSAPPQTSPQIPATQGRER